MFKKIAKSIAGPVVGGLFGMAGGAQQASSAKAASQAQMDFQERMSNTSYQRAMKDMREAGLNPILAYQQGGASSPGGSTYSPPNIGQAAVEGASSALAMKNMHVQNSNIQQQTDKTREDTVRQRLENEAFERLSPEQRLLFLAANPVASGVSALRGVAPLVSSSARGLGSVVSKSFSKTPSGRIVDYGRKLLRRK